MMRSREPVDGKALEPAIERLVADPAACRLHLDAAVAVRYAGRVSWA